MKTLLCAVLCLVMPLHATDSAPAGVLRESKYTTLDASAVRIALTEKYDIVWSSPGSAGKILSINGLTSLYPLSYSDLSTGHIFTAKETQRPEKPEEITIDLWTKDGRHFKARWEEVK